MSVTAPAAVATRGTLVPRARRRRRAGFDKISLIVVCLVLPLALYLLLVIYPFLQSVYYSMTDWSGFSSGVHFVLFSNYGRIFQDDVFLKAVGNSLLLALVLPLVTILLSFVLATLVTIGGSSHGNIRGLKYSGFYRVISFFPYVIPAIAIGIMWGQIYDPSAGALNGILTGLGLDRFKSYPWLGAQATAMPATMFVIIWSFVGFYMVLFIAAIKGIPAELIEAARLDGAGRIRTAVSVTIPQIVGSIRTAYIYMGIVALDAFVYMQALNPGGGPNNSTLVMSQQLFTTAFAKGQFGVACAMGVVVAAATLAFSGLVFLVTRLLGGGSEGPA
jgi:N-acetylglucosamine transport system permease protein